VAAGVMCVYHVFLKKKKAKQKNHQKILYKKAKQQNPTPQHLYCFFLVHARLTF